MANSTYERLADVIDRVKTDERNLDTDEYVGMILDTLEAHMTVRESVRLMLDGATSASEQLAEGTCEPHTVAAAIQVIEEHPHATSVDDIFAPERTEG